VVGSDITNQITTEFQFSCSLVAPLIFHCGLITHKPPTIRGGLRSFWILAKLNLVSPRVMWLMRFFGK
jgi:hypothetical protein